MKFPAVFAALALAAVPAAAIRSFSGWNCDGNASPQYNCDGSCHSFVRPQIRHSFQTRHSGQAHCITMYEDEGCPNYGRQSWKYHTFSGQNGQCQKVDTGTPIRSYRCSSNDVCSI